MAEANESKQIKVVAPFISKLQLTTQVVDDKDKNGEIIGADIETVVQFQFRGEPGIFDDIFREMNNYHNIHVLFGSPQLIRDFVDDELTEKTSDIFKYELGDELRDRVTGYTGTCLVRCQYGSGCRNYGLQAAIDKNGKLPEWQYFDELRLEKTGY